MAKELKCPRRTEQEIVNDLTAILQLKGLHYDTRRGVAWKAIWDFSEIDGRLDNPRFGWSRRAEALRKKNKGGARGLRREHCFPMAGCIDSLLALPSPTFDEVLALLRRAATVYVLTAEEDAAVNRKFRSKWPAGYALDDPLARYKATTGIVIEFARHAAASVPNARSAVSGSPGEPGRA